MKTLVIGATVVTVDDQDRVLSTGDILIDSGKIVEIGEISPERSRGAEVIDASGMIAIPGLVNAHIHLWQTSFRGAGANWISSRHHAVLQSGIVPKHMPEDLYRSELIGAASLLNGGVTSVFDFCHGNRTPEHSDAAIQGLREAGIRGYFGHGTVKTLPGTGEPHFSEVPHPRDEALRLSSELRSDDLLDLALCVLGPDYSVPDVARHDFALIAELGAVSSAHVSGIPGRTPGGYRQLSEEGLLGPHHLAVHATHMPDTELASLVDAGSTVVATAAVEHGGGHMEPVIRRVIELGGTPAIGTDSELDTSGSMLKAMRDSLVIQRHFYAVQKQRSIERLGETERARLAEERQKYIGVGAGGVSGSVSVTTYDALRWATIESARAIGLGEKIGSLEVGKRADIALLDARSINMAPAHDPIDAVVKFAHDGNVDTVLVDGVVKKRAGRLVEDEKYAAIAHAAAERGKRLLHDAGVRTSIEEAPRVAVMKS